MKVMRDNPKTLKNAFEVANAGKKMRRRFDLRAGNPSQISHATGTEPMEVDHARPTLRCYKCNRQGHRAKDCRSHRADINAVNQMGTSGRPRPRSDIVCWSCDNRGHFANECWQNKKPRQAGGRPGQTTATKKQGN